MKTPHENKKLIKEITFEQVKKQTLGIQGPKYNLCKVLAMC